MCRKTNWNWLKKKKSNNNNSMFPAQTRVFTQLKSMPNWTLSDPRLHTLVKAIWMTRLIHKLFLSFNTFLVSFFSPLILLISNFPITSLTLSLLPFLLFWFQLIYWCFYFNFICLSVLLTDNIKHLFAIRLLQFSPQRMNEKINKIQFK